MFILIILSFYLTNNTGTLHGDDFGRIKPLSYNSCNWVFSSFNSVGAILYGHDNLAICVGRDLVWHSYMTFSGPVL
jgi:hypothetical protein